MEFKKTRPAKRRRTKGRHELMEDDLEAADGVMVRSIIQQTESGPVEKIWEEPVWFYRRETENKDVDDGGR